MGEELAVDKPSCTRSRGGHGTLRVGDAVNAEMAPFLAGDGTTTTLRDSLFSTVPGSPAYVGRAHRHTVNLPQYGTCFEGRNAIQADYHITHTASG